MPVAVEVAHAVDAPLDVILVRKLGVPSRPELAMGALGEDGVRVVDATLVERLGISERGLARVEARVATELERRARRYRGERTRSRSPAATSSSSTTGWPPAPPPGPRPRRPGPGGVLAWWLRFPSAPPETVVLLGDQADDVISLDTLSTMVAVGAAYVDFSPTSDEEVVALLEGSDVSEAARRSVWSRRSSGAGPAARTEGPRAGMMSEAASRARGADEAAERGRAAGSKDRERE